MVIGQRAAATLFTLGLAALTGCSAREYEMGQHKIRALPISGGFWNISSNGSGAGTLVNAAEFAKLGGFTLSDLGYSPGDNVTINLSVGGGNWERSVNLFNMKKTGDEQYGLPVLKGDEVSTTSTFEIPAPNAGTISCILYMSVCILNMDDKGFSLTATYPASALPRWRTLVPAYGAVIGQAIVK